MPDSTLDVVVPEAVSHPMLLAHSAEVGHSLLELNLLEQPSLTMESDILEVELLLHRTPEHTGWPMLVFSMSCDTPRVLLRSFHANPSYS